MMAEELNGVIQQQYPGRSTVLEVSEDGENGCTIMFPAKEKNKSDFTTYEEMVLDTNTSSSGVQ